MNTNAESEYQNNLENGINRPIESPQIEVKKNPNSSTILSIILAISLTLSTIIIILSQQKITKLSEYNSRLSLQENKINSELEIIQDIENVSKQAPPVKESVIGPVVSPFPSPNSKIDWQKFTDLPIKTKSGNLTIEGFDPYNNLYAELKGKLKISIDQKIVFSSSECQDRENEINLFCTYTFSPGYQIDPTEQFIALEMSGIEGKTVYLLVDLDSGKSIFIPPSEQITNFNWVQSDKKGLYAYQQELFNANFDANNIADSGQGNYAIDINNQFFTITPENNFASGRKSLDIPWIYSTFYP